MDTIDVIWGRRSATDLARRMDALADRLADLDPVDGPTYATLIRSVLTCDFNPLPDRLPELGDPPTLRPPFPTRPEPGS